MTHQITPIEGDLADLMNKSFQDPKHSGYIIVDGFILTECYRKFADAIENFEIREDDIWLCGFPKTGTTWTREMVWCIANDLNFEGAKVLLDERSPFFELSTIIDFTMLPKIPGLEISERIKDSVNFVANLPSPRFIKTHLPFNLLPRQLRTGEKKPKIVHVVRNPKDTCISYFHHARLQENFVGNFEDYCTLFIGDRVQYAPFWKNALSFWEKRAEENILLLKYEDMKKDLPSVIKKTAKFFGKNLTTEQVSTLAEHLSLASMKANPSVNKKDSVTRLKRHMNFKGDYEFIRNGNVEQWKTDMSPEIIERFDNWTRDNVKGISAPPYS